MFTTFVNTDPDKERADQTEKLSAPRPKREQVSRACEWCRAYRIKCDKDIPCRNCRIRGRECVDKANGGVRTFSRAVSEIDRLQSRIQELEVQLEEHHISSQPSQVSRTRSPARDNPSSLAKHLDARREHGGNKRQWQSVHMMTAQSAESQCYGPASNFYFIGRMGEYLGNILQHPHLDQYLPINPPSPSLFLEGYSEGIDDLLSNQPLTRPQEDYYLNLYWQSYHCIYPVLDEFDFKAHQRSLWTTSLTQRKSSSLVDIVLALCVQYSNALGSTNGTSTGITITDRRLYRKCQAQLADELEGPSIHTLQCLFLSVIYLLNASFYNTAHSILAQAIRVGIVLGLHLEPPDIVPKAQRNFRRRLWWTLYALEMKMAMDLGRPLAVNIGQVTCSLPDDDQESAMLSTFNSTFVYNAANCYTSNMHYIKLILSTRSVYVTFYNKCAEALGRDREGSLYDDHQALESCAEFLTSKMEYLDIWLRDVPVTLKTKRIELGKAFSTDGTRLDLTQFTPLWHQRQGIFLELLYHNQAMNLYRPFINFSRVNRSLTPQAEKHAAMCANHAISITLIIQQLLMETEVLQGWHETFQWQWNATVSMIGYVLAYPDGAVTTAACDAIRSAIEVFEILSVHFPIAGSAASIARDLSTKADIFITRFQRSPEEMDHFIPKIGEYLGDIDGFNLDNTGLDLWNFDQTQVDLLLQWTEEDPGSTI